MHAPGDTTFRHAAHSQHAALAMHALGSTYIRHATHTHLHPTRKTFPTRNTLHARSLGHLHPTRNTHALAFDTQHTPCTLLGTPASDTHTHPNLNGKSSTRHLVPQRQTLSPFQQNTRGGSCSWDGPKQQVATRAFTPASPAGIPTLRGPIQSALYCPGERRSRTNACDWLGWMGWLRYLGGYSSFLSLDTLVGIPPRVSLSYLVIKAHFTIPCPEKNID